MKDIDGLWRQYDLYRFIPEPWQYTAVGLAVALPFILVCSLLCCLMDDEEAPAKPQHTPKVSNEYLFLRAAHGNKVNNFSDYFFALNLEYRSQ